MVPSGQFNDFKSGFEALPSGHELMVAQQQLKALKSISIKNLVKVCLHIWSINMTFSSHRMDD